MVNRQELLKSVGAAAAKGYEVFGPVREDGRVMLSRIGDPGAIDFDHVITVNTLKDILLPRTEKVAGLDLEMAVVTGQQESRSPILIFGSRPCDAAGIAVLDKILLGPVRDTRYEKRRQRTVIVTLACVECDQACFCTSMGYGPHDLTGSDVIVVPVEDKFAVRYVTPKGKAFLESVGLASDGEARKEEVAKEGKVPELSRRIDFGRLKAWLDSNFESPLWKSVSEGCVGCGTCYYLCPTCHCFDITDETGLSSGERLRIWDTCSFSGFTKMAGHQPRTGRHARYRQRVMHKFAYCPDNCGAVACVGDGRCIRHCPYGVDICEVIEKLLARK
jgi:sulfhydrogenase subunit beta (sulfur reductase)